MNIIGIYDGHNASVAYFKNNKIEFAINEERIVKKKNQSGFPINSLEYLFKNYKITNKNLDYVAIAGTFRDDLNDLLYEWSYNFNIDEHKRLMQDFWHNKLNNKNPNSKLFSSPNTSSTEIQYCFCLALSCFHVLLERLIK